jgi:GH24 family phage-related lysozyme (muramidase)
MKISKNGLDLIKSFEGCRLTAYKDAVGVWTIGWGHTAGVRSGMTITQAQADEYLKQDLNKYEKAVEKYNYIYHWNQNEFDALTSFAYNIGSIDQLTNNGKRTKAQISDKILAYNKAGGKVLTGLTRRRKAEKALFDKEIRLDGWSLIGEKWYYFENGSMQSSKWVNTDGKDYYLMADGSMATNQFIKASDYATTYKMYWVGSDGAWDGKTYRWMKNDVGWWIASVGGSWYPKNEWYTVEDKTYYFNSSGYMVTGTKTIDGRIYSFASDGHLVG